MTPGFLGTRADTLIDLAVVFFLAAPFLMLYVGLCLTCVTGVALYAMAYAL